MDPSVLPAALLFVKNFIAFCQVGPRLGVAHHIPWRGLKQQNLLLRVEYKSRPGECLITLIRLQLTVAVMLSHLSIKKPGAPVTRPKPYKQPITFSYEYNKSMSTG